MRQPERPLRWTDTVLDLQDLIKDSPFTAYVVGGAVRDAYLGRPLHDIDLTTPDDAIQLAKFIANALKGHFYVMDSERGVSRALVDGPNGHYVIDVAGFRGEDIHADLIDRDFTFNAMATSLDNLTMLLDPLNGEADLKARVLRECSPAAFANDPLRTVRAVRISSQFNARIEPQTLANLRAALPQLGTISAERLRDEFFKMLGLPRPMTALRVARALDILNAILPDVQDDATLLAVEKMSGILATISPRRTDLTAAVFDLGMIVMSLDTFRVQLQAHIAHVWPNERAHEAILLLATLLAFSDDPNAHLRTLRLSSDEIRRVLSAVNNYAAVFEIKTDDLSLHRFWYEHMERGVDHILLAMAVYLGKMGRSLKQDDWIQRLEHIQTVIAAYYVRYDTIVSPPPLINGNALMDALDLKPGKQIGDLLKIIREAQVLGQVSTQDDEIGRA